jgi:hypothetical protein
MSDPPEKPKRPKPAPEGQMSIEEYLGLDAVSPPPPPPPPPPTTVAPSDPGDGDGGEDHEGMSQSEGQGETSKAAASWIGGKSGKLRLTVLWAIRSAPNGLTDEQGYTALGMAANTWRPRRVELHKGWKDFDGGYITDSGRRRRTVSGRLAIVWVATEKGRNA